MKKDNIVKLVLSAVFLTLAYVMPFLTGQIPEIGAMLCPMHIPVFLCGFICGWPYGLAVGFIAPLSRSLILGMPPFFPGAVCMAFELATYGLVSGLLHKILPKKNMFIYVSLISAMILGRIVWGAAMFVCMGINGGAFTFSAFIAGAITNSLLGIVSQLILIPVIIILWQKVKISNSEK